MKKSSCIILFPLFFLVSCSINNNLINNTTSNSGSELTDDKITKLLESQSNQDYYVYKHEFLRENEMPILGMISPVGTNAGNGGSPSFINKENFQIYKDAGFNIVLPCYERTNFKQAECREAVQVCNELGLVYIANDTNFRCSGSEGEVHSVQEYEECMSDLWYAKEKSFGGIATKDEPNYDDFTEIGKGSLAYKNKFPETGIFHSTLFPYYAPRSMIRVGDLSPYEFDWNSYKFYVDAYISKVNPNVLAFDAYLWHVITQETLTQANTRDHFMSMSMFRERSIIHRKPFWVTIASFKHGGPAQYTEAETAWTVNTSLAYGCKGIQYYTYWPQMEKYTSDDFSTNINRTALVSANGVPLDAYYRVKHINSQIKAVENVLMPAESKGIMQFGNYKNIIPDCDQLASFGNLMDITGGDAFVGCFILNGKNIYYIVNNSINDGSGSGIIGDSVFHVNFKQKINVKYLNNDTDAQIENNTSNISFTLSAGQAMLVEEI